MVENILLRPFVVRREAYPRYEVRRFKILVNPQMQAIQSSETSILTTLTLCQVPKEVCNWCRRENVSADSVRRPKILFLYGEAN
jgi:hypothetical protein